MARKKSVAKPKRTAKAKTERPKTGPAKTSPPTPAHPKKARRKAEPAARSRKASPSPKSARTTRSAARASRERAVGGVAAWEDDPASGFPIRITSAAPDIATGPLAVRIIQPAVAPPAQIYKEGTAEFRYWAAAEALDRARLFWAPLLTGTGWHTGDDLPVTLDAGVDLNAYYDRKGLSFFHEVVQGTTYYSGESPDIVCHELGHAILDALRPELWDAASDEIAAFHESFGDVSAMVSALQLQTVRVQVLQATNGKIARTSRLSRLAEQLGTAIRLVRPDAADPDCLRNAANSFFYQSPLSLPPVGPASVLSSEPHSFSRVFTGAFLDSLAGVLSVMGSAQPTEDELQAAALELTRLLVQAVRAAAVVPDFMSQVAAGIVAADAQSNRGRFGDVLKSAFVRRGILTLETAAAPTPAGVTRSAALTEYMAPAAPPIVLPGSELGMASEIGLEVQAPGQAHRFATRSAAVGPGPAPSADSQSAAMGYVTDLFRRGRVYLPRAGEAADGVRNPIATKTHQLEARERSGVMRLVRLRFDCGFDCARF